MVVDSSRVSGPVDPSAGAHYGEGGSPPDTDFLSVPYSTAVTLNPSADGRSAIPDLLKHRVHPSGSPALQKSEGNDRSFIESSPRIRLLVLVSSHRNVPKRSCCFSERIVTTKG